MEQAPKSESKKLSPYIAGPLIAVLFMLGYYLINSPPGIDEGYRIISDYCKERIETGVIDVNQRPPLVWQTAFLAGILIGGALGAFSGSDWRLSIFPEGGGVKGMLSSAWTSPLSGLIGGFLVMTGLQISGASFLGQWAAAMMLSTGAWIFIFATLIWGVIFYGIINSRSAGGKDSKSASGKDKK